MLKVHQYIIFLTIQLGCFSISLAQPVNLVPNPSFEDTIDYNNGFFAPKFWDMTLASPNYFNSSFKAPLEGRKTPLSFYGYQIPKNGIAYGGLITKNISDPGKREYIQTKLIQTLKTDSLYNLTFYVNLPDSFHLACEQKNIAFAFSDTMIDIPQSLHKQINWLYPIYFSDSTWDPKSKKKWEKISKIFKAKGHEKFLIIGNFLPDNQSSLINIGGGDKDVYKINSYYFIDQIELILYKTLQSDTTIESLSKIIIPNIFTPNADGINDIWQIQNDSQVQEVFIYNRWGNKIYFWKGAGGSWSGGNNAAGVYFYKVIFLFEGQQQIKHGNITLLR